jgi:hypothetical protein
MDGVSSRIHPFPALDVWVWTEFVSDMVEWRVLAITVMTSAWEFLDQLSDYFASQKVHCVMALFTLY